MRPGAREDDHNDTNEVSHGLYLRGFNIDLVNWILIADLGSTGELDEVRRAVRLYGNKNLQRVQSHVSEA